MVLILSFENYIYCTYIKNKMSMFANYFENYYKIGMKFQENILISYNMVNDN